MRTDSELLQEFRKTGSRDAFAEIVSRHGGMVYRTCLRVTGSERSAQEAAQAAFLILARQQPRSLNGTFAGWLHSAALKMARKALRVKARSARDEGEITDGIPVQEMAD